MTYVVTENCIRCDVCVPECPAEAIFADSDLPAGQEAFLAINAELAQQWPVINRKKNPLPEADEWNGVAGKLKLLERCG